MAGILVMAAIPSGRRLISRVGVEPKWLLSSNSANTAMVRRIGSMTPLYGERVVSRHHEEPAGHKGHGWGYAAILGVTVGMVALICFYLCVWLLQRMSRKFQRSNAQLPLEPEQTDGEDDGPQSTDGTKRAPSGDGESATQTWNSKSVELVVMAGEHVPTFVAHPVVQCPAQLQKNVPWKTSISLRT